MNALNERLALKLLDYIGQVNDLRSIRMLRYDWGLDTLFEFDQLEKSFIQSIMTKYFPVHATHGEKSVSENEFETETNIYNINEKLKHTKAHSCEYIELQRRKEKCIDDAIKHWQPLYRTWNNFQTYCILQLVFGEGLISKLRDYTWGDLTGNSLCLLNEYKSWYNGYTCCYISDAKIKILQHFILKLTGDN